MKAPANGSLSVVELVERFVVLGLAQYEAVEGFQTGRYNRLYDRVAAVVAELQARDGDQRRALLPMLESDNPQLRYLAATALRSIAPLRSRQAYQRLREEGRTPWSLDASIAIHRMDGIGLI
jgi:hypothetical protein